MCFGQREGKVGYYAFKSYLAIASHAKIAYPTVNEDV